jgi:hypothetical protein
MGFKPGDEWCVSLCVTHHREQHRLSHRLFDAKYEVDLRALAVILAERSPALKHPAA